MSSRRSSPRSEDLLHLRPLFQEGSFLNDLGNIFQLNLIVDANVLLGDIRWLAKKRTSPGALPGLLESINAGTVRAFAPTFLIVEMEKIIPEISERESIDQNEMTKYWEVYKPLIRYVDVDGHPEEGIEYRDPKDIPYLRLQSKIDALILTGDSDISGMDGKVINVTVIARLRTYSREAAIEYTLKVQGAGVFVVSAAVFEAGVKFLKTLTQNLARIPSSFWIGCALLIGCLLLYPKSRQWVLNRVSALSGESKRLGVKFIKVVGPMLEEHQRANEAAEEALGDVKNEIAKKQPSAQPDP